MLRVKNKSCEECLFSKNKIVTNARMKQVLKDCEKQDTFFICHKSSINGDNICCRGFYENKTCNLIRIAHRLNAVEFVS